MTPAEFVRAWGQDDLIRYAPNVVEPLNIPETAKRFLIEAGLPRVAMRYLHYDLPPNDLPTVRKFWNGRFSPPQSCAEYRVIGIHAFDHDRYVSRQSKILYCINEEHGGRVVNVRADKDWEVNFLNSSIPQLAEFFLIFRQDLEWRAINWNNSTEDEIRKHRKEVLEQLHYVDLEACGPATVWGGVGGMIFDIEFEL